MKMNHPKVELRGWRPSGVATVVILGMLLHGICLRSLAQATGSDPRDQQIEELLKRVSELERKLGGMEARTLAPSSSLPNPLNPTPSLTPGVTDAETGMDAVREHRLFPNLTFKGFGDVQYRYSDAKGANNTFAIGQLELFPMSRLAENLSTFSEIVFGFGSDNKSTTTIERVLVQYTPNDFFNLGVGRYHTSLGYYNSAYHHGAWLQTSVGRPLIYNTSIVFPVHNTGLTVNGRIPSGKLGLNYVVEVGNGRHYGARADESNQSVSDDNAYKSFNLGLIARPAWVTGLEMGLSVYHDTLTPAGSSAVDQFILVVHAVYKAKPWEILNEFMLYRHDPRGGVPASYTPGFYSQVGYQFGRVTPYLRYDYQDASNSDVIFANFGSLERQHGPTLGLRFDVSDYVAFKFQYGHLLRENASAVNTLTAQLAYTF
jgi:hypothetical protein